MLTQINISDFAIIKNLALEFSHGMTVITGETGAGKSIVIDALDIALGGRADPQFIRQDAERSDIHLIFDIRDIPMAKTWLGTHDLLAENDCIIRRQLSREGRSKCFINGHPVTSQQLRELASHLIHIHSQHQHYALLNKDTQRHMLDGLLRQPELLADVKQAFYTWQAARSALTNCLERNIDANQRALLTYQVHELDELDLAPNEWELLTQQQQQLAHSETLLTTLQQSLDLLDGNDHNILQYVHRLIQNLTAIQTLLPSVRNCLSLLQNTDIQLREAVDELKDLFDHITTDPDTLSILEERMRILHATARKHQVTPDNLFSHHQTLQKQLEELTQSDDQIEARQQEVKAAWEQYVILANQLHDLRVRSADKIAQQVTKSIQQLGMLHGEFAISINFDHELPTAYGLDQVEFQVNLNPGQSLMSMAKVASGGELSRISLAIQVMMAAQGNTPTLIFDEVDVGISGATAEIVGHLLRQLGKTTQVLCITHLPQVAAQGEHHVKITKKTTNHQTISELYTLSASERIQEIARMVGGVTITSQTLAYAKELLTHW